MLMIMIELKVKHRNAHFKKHNNVRDKNLVKKWIRLQKHKLISLSVTDINHMCKPSITYYHSFVKRFVKKHKKGRKAPYVFIFIGHLSNSGDLLMLFFVRRRASCGVRRAWTFLTSWKDCYHFLVWNISLIREILVVKFMAQPSPRATYGTKSAKKSRISKIFSTPTHVRKKLDAWLWFPCNPKLWKSWPMGQWFKL